MLKGLWARMFGGDAGEVEGEAIEYEGYRVRPTPYRRGSEFQTCGVIEKEIGGEVKQHRFVRAEMHPSREAAIEFSLAKARQIIDEQGERMFR
ncbi:MAG TPA: HlyU family transcriptional regulator [Stellaceae bacterium]|nr:HlyU family transcriptional regulator [Stellaceae bacterium]